MTDQNISIEETAAAMDGASISETPGNGYEVNLIDVLTLLANRKPLIAKITGAAALAGLVLCFLLPVRYTATAKIMTPQQTQSTASMLMTSQLTSAGGGGMAALAGGGLSLKNPNDVYVGLLTSRPIADAIIQKFSLAKVYHADTMTKARRALASYTEVTSEKGGFIVVSVKDTDKKRVADMANAYTDQLRILTKTLAVTEASQRRYFYEEQLKQAREALVAAELAFQQVQQQKGLVQLDAQAKAMIEGVASLRAQVAAKQVEVETRRSYSTERNPDVQLAERELASLQAEMTRLEQNNHSPGIAGLGLGNVTSAGLEYIRAAHELAYRQAVFDMLLKQYDAAKLDEAKEAAIIQVVEPAIEPDRKSDPKRSIILLISGFLGLLSGCVLAMFLDWLERRKANPEGAEALRRLRCALTGKT
jgi:tyrosine-protein kinase Etk/Wzc